MIDFDLALGLTVAASIFLGVMLGYGWLYPKYWQALRDLDDYYDAQGEWLAGLQRERDKLLDVQVDLDIMKRERSAFKAKQSANGKKARALTDDERDQILAIKDDGLALWETVNVMGQSREISMAKTKIEEAVMWAVKHITA